MALDTKNENNGQAIFAIEVADVLEALKCLLIEKNRKYGDAALNPQRTFSRGSAVDLIDVRIDDKLSRIKNRLKDDAEDPIWDLLGYLVLRTIAVRRIKETPMQPMQHRRVERPHAQD